MTSIPWQTRWTEFRQQIYKICMADYQTLKLDYYGNTCDCNHQRHRLPFKNTVLTELLCFGYYWNYQDRLYMPSWLHHSFRYDITHKIRALQLPTVLAGFSNRKHR